MIFKHLLHLRESELKFPVAGDLVTDGVIKERKAALTSSELVREKKKLFCMAFGIKLFGLMAFFNFIILPTILHVKSFSLSEGMLWFVCWALPLGIMVYLSEVLEKNNTVLCDLNKEADHLEPLPPHHCKSMLELCLATSEGKAYREAVLAQNRQFVLAEKMMLERWNSGVAAREECAKLYAVGGEA